MYLNTLTSHERQEVTNYGRITNLFEESLGPLLTTLIKGQ